MPLKSVFRHLKTAFNDCFMSYAVDSYLCKKGRNAASDLKVTKDIASQKYDLLSFCKVSYISLVVDASRIESGPSLLVGSSRNDQISYFFLRQLASILTGIALDDFVAPVPKQLCLSLWLLSIEVC